MKKNFTPALHWQILIAIVIGFILAQFFYEQAPYVSWMGEVFLRALKMIALPLVAVSIISGVVNVGDSGNLGRLGIKTFSFYIVSGLLAIATGLIAVNLVQPGKGVDLGLAKNVDHIAAAEQSFDRILINMIPSNVFESLAKGDMLPVIVFVFLLGLFITKLPEKHRTILTDFSNASFELMMAVTNFIIKLTPIGVFGLIFGLVAEHSGPGNSIWEVFQGLGVFMLTVLGALVFHLVVTLSALLIIGKINPLKHAGAMLSALLTAFSTASSSATLPLTMECVEEKAGVSNRVSSFVLPLGATVNMNGTALYECVAVLFIAQVYGQDLSFMQQLTVVVTALLTSMGAAGIPMASLVMMSVILAAVGLPLEGVGLILAVDRILDMLRTATNVYSDSCGAAVIARSEKEKLKVEL